MKVLLQKGVTSSKIVKFITQRVAQASVSVDDVHSKALTFMNKKACIKAIVHIH